MVAVDVLLGRRPTCRAPDVVLCVVAAGNLARNLYLVSQVLELGRPMVVALTMVDVAGARACRRRPAAERQLGVPVVPIQAHRGLGRDLKDASAAGSGRDPVRSRRARSRRPFATRSTGWSRSWPKVIAAAQSRCLATWSAAAARHRRLRRGADSPATADRSCDRQVGAARAARRRAARCRPSRRSARYGWVARVVEGVVAHPVEPVVTSGDRLDAVLTHQLWGTLILAVVMLLIFSAVFAWAELPMDGIEAGIRGWPA